MLIGSIRRLKDSGLALRERTFGRERSVQWRDGGKRRESHWGHRPVILARA